MPLSLLIILLAGALCGLLAAEIFSLVRDNRRITLRCEVNMNLTEPDEVVTLTYVVQNTSRFPMPFVSFCFELGGLFVGNDFVFEFRTVNFGFFVFVNVPNTMLNLLANIFYTLILRGVKGLIKST